MDVTINIPGSNPLETITSKKALEKIAKNFSNHNLQKIADLSDIPDANNKLQKLFDNPLFKMAIK